LGQTPAEKSSLLQIPISKEVRALKKWQSTEYEASDSKFPIGFFFGYLNGNPTQLNKSTFSGLTGAFISAEYQISKTNLIASIEAMAGTTASSTQDIVYMDQNNPVQMEMNILNNSNIFRFGLTYKFFNSRMISPLIFANAGRMGSLTLLTIEKPNPERDEPRQYINRADIHKDSTVGYGYGVGIRFEFSRLYAVTAEPIGVLDVRIGTWHTGPIEYMNANARIRADLKAGSTEEFTDVLAPNYQFESEYYTDYIYKTPMDMLYFSVSLGIRFGASGFD
jgi:hypothetical protein